MIRLLSSLAAGLIIYFVYGFYVSQLDFSVVRTSLTEPVSVSPYHDYRGVFNVHTTLGRGSASPQAVINIARDSDLKFLAITDINQFSQSDQFDGYHGPLLVLQEPEFPYLDSRTLILNSNETPMPANLGESSVLVADLLSQNNPESRQQFVGFLHNSRSEFGWNGEPPTGVDGIEILNPRSIAYQAWETSKVNVIISLMIYPFNSLLAFLRLYQEPASSLMVWDETSQRKHLVGFAGAEASARAIPLANYLLKFPSYRSSFFMSSNHVLMDSELTGNYKKDRQKLVAAIKKGQMYFSIDLLGDPTGFFAEVRTRGQKHLMGAELRYNSDMKIYARLAQEPNVYYEMVLLKDGQRIETSNSTELEVALDSPGVYRVIVRVSSPLPLPDGKKWITWVFSNPFFIRP